MLERNACAIEAHEVYASTRTRSIFTKYHARKYPRKRWSQPHLANFTDQVLAPIYPSSLPRLQGGAPTSRPSQVAQSIIVPMDSGCSHEFEPTERPYRNELEAKDYIAALDREDQYEEQLRVKTHISSCRQTGPRTWNSRERTNRRGAPGRNFSKAFRR